MPKHIGETFIKVMPASFVVSLLLAFFNIEPKEFLEKFGGSIQSIFEIVARIVRWTVKYILLGGVVVVPIWLIFTLIGKARVK